MAELIKLASAVFPPGDFHHDQNIIKPHIKDFHTFNPNNGKRQNVDISPYKQKENPQFEHPWKIPNHFSDNQIHGTMPAANKPVLQDICADSMLFSLDVAEQCAKHEKFSKFLMNGTNIMEGDGLNVPLISDLMGFQAVDVPNDNELAIHETELENMQKVIYPQNKIYLPQPLLDFVENLSNNSLITVHLDGQVLFADNGSEVEMRNLFSILQEFSLSSNISNGSRKAMVVPYFTRKRGGHAKVNNHISTIMNPSKSAEKSKTKPQQRSKQNKSTSKERRDKIYLYWCDCLLNLYVDKTMNKATISDVKETSPEIMQVVSRTSAITVAIGFVVIFNIALKTVFNGAVLFSPANLFTASFGLGFFWLSSSMNKLTYGVYSLSKMSNRAKKPNEERMIVERIKKSINDVMFRFAVLAMVGLLKF